MKIAGMMIYEAPRTLEKRDHAKIVDSGLKLMELRERNLLSRQATIRRMFNRQFARFIALFIIDFVHRLTMKVPHNVRK